MTFHADASRLVAIPHYLVAGQRQNPLVLVSTNNISHEESMAHHKNRIQHLHTYIFRESLVNMCDRIIDLPFGAEVPRLGHFQKMFSPHLDKVGHIAPPFLGW